MDIITVLLIILAAITAMGIVVFQYFYRVNKRKDLSIILSFLRFISLFGLFLLLINPKFSKEVYSLEKPTLIVLTDNSSSVAPFKEAIVRITNSIKESGAIAEQFNLSEYRFDGSLNESDSSNFDGKNTDIAKALSSIGDIYSNTNSAILMITDGNQTLGRDYEFYANSEKLPVYPIVVGDTTTYEDVRIDQVNTNRFAFLKNKFPMEVYVSYVGRQNIAASLSVSVDGSTVYRQNLSFSNSDNSKIINTLLDANSVGSKSVQVKISPLERERNTLNNLKTVAIEVIDEKVNVGIISDIQHPDIGALTKAIESNEQRSVSIKKLPVSGSELEEIDLFVLYQPSTTFRSVYEYIEKRKATALTISGTHTDWQFFSAIQNQYEVEDNGIVQEVTPVINAAFSKYDISGYSFEGYPPLTSSGELIGAYSAFDILLNMRIKGVTMRSPLMFVTDFDNHKRAFILGENLWKWRMQSYRDHQDFKNFDDFFGKLIVYLSENESKDRLQLDYRPVYEGSNNAKISATYFDEAFVFDPNATILLNLKGQENGVSLEVPMLLKGAVYESDLSNLEPGQYNFTVKVKEGNRTKSGIITILDFDVEQQFPSSNFKKLNQLAMNTNGKLFYPSDTDALIENVTKDQRYRPIQSSTKNVVSLIDFRLILGFIAAALSLEWFIRKFNGLI